MFVQPVKGSPRVSRVISRETILRSAGRFFLLLIVTSLTISAQEILTNDAVVKMVKAGLPESVIVEMVRSRPGKYSVTTESLIQLKQQGVTEKVLSAIVTKSSDPSSEGSRTSQSPVVPPTPPRSSTGEPTGRWEIRDTKDALTGDEDFDAHLLAKNDRSERVDVTAWCEIEHTGLASALGGLSQLFPGNFFKGVPQVPGRQLFNFRVAYQSSTAGKGIEIDTQQLSPATVTPRLGTYEVSGPINIKFAPARVRLDDRVYPDRLGGDSKAVLLSFANVKTSDQMKGMMASATNGDPLVSRLLDFGLAPVGQFESPMTSNDLLRAHRLWVDLPLSDGTRTDPALDLKIEDPSFRKFAARCAARFAAATPPPASTAPALRPSPLQSLTDRRYAGTVDGFAAALPGLIQHAVNAMGLDAKNYDKEADFIAGAVRTCSQITPQMYASLTGRGTRPDLSKFGEQYRICNGSTIRVSEQMKYSNREVERGIELQMAGVGSYGMTDNRGFGAVVSFSSLKGDSFRDVSFENYGIVAASIYSSASDVKHPLTATSLQKLTNRRYEGTADGFATAFPGFLQQAAAAMSLDPKNYEKEAAFIIAAVQTCAQITPQMAQTAAKRGGINLRTLGEQYAICSPGFPGFRFISDDVKKNYNKELERGIWLNVENRDEWLRNGQGFIFRVYFSNLNNESLVPESHFNTLGIVEAKIH